MSTPHEPPSLDDLRIAVATYRGKTLPQAKTGRPLTWEQLCRHLSVHEERATKDGKLWSPVRLNVPYRENDNVVETYAFVADVDDYTDPEEYLAGFEEEGLAYLAYSTYSHHPERPKFRVVLPFARPITAEEHGAVWRGFAHVYGHIDPVCKDRSRAYFTPACPPPEEREGDPWVRSGGGKPLDPDFFITLAPPPSPPRPQQDLVFPMNGHRPNAKIILERSLSATAGKARHYRGFHLAEQLRDNRYSESEAVPVVLEMQRQLENEGDHPYTEREALASLTYAYRQPARDPWPEKPLTPLSRAAARELREGATETTEATGERNYVVSVAPFLQETEAVPPLTLEPEALYGLPGMVVNAIAPCTESSPAAILASFLVGVGCLIGRGPHVYRDGAYHGVNEFACLVGLTSAGRKGTATRRAEEILAAVGDVITISERDILSVYDMHEARARSWRDLLLPGLGSGEALVASLAAAKGQEVCPRRLVLEEEFSKPLRIMQREGSTLSETLRAAWDGSILANVTKAKSLRVPSSHVSILAHITENEMKLRLGAAEMFNGFANRFLWFCTSRSQSLPFGGGDAPTGPAVAALRQALLQVRHAKRVEFDKAVKHIWDKGKVYELLLNRPPGLLGAVTSRGEVHVTRLSLLYALLDGEIEIRLPHLMAALAVWDFSEKSAAYLFGQSTGDDCADTILELLQDVYPGGLTRTEIRDGFRRNAAPGRIPAALTLLERVGKARRASMESGSPGRPTEIWCCTSAKTCDKNDITPLSLARSLL